MSTIQNPQGAVKLEEVVVNQDPATLVNLPSNSDSLSYVNTIKDILADAQRRLGHILWSNGRVAWTQITGNYRIDLNPDPPAATDIRLRITQSELTGTNQRSIELIIPGTTITTLGNNTYPILANDLVYIDVDVAALEAANLASINVVDGITNLSATGTAVVRKVSMTAGGLPRTTQANSAYIPLFMRQDYTVNAVNFSDCWWIPHGIRWPKETVSTIGAVLTSGAEAWPQYFVANETELNTALSQAAGAGGGIILPKQAITITGTANVPANTMIVGRGIGVNGITVASGAVINLAARAELRGLAFSVVGTTGAWLNLTGEQSILKECAISYSTNASDRQVVTSGYRCKIIDTTFTNTQATVASTFSFVDVGSNMVLFKDCKFTPSSAHTMVCVDVMGSNCRLEDCVFDNVKIDLADAFVPKSVKLYSDSNKRGCKLFNCYETNSNFTGTYQGGGLVRKSIDISSMATGNGNMHWSGNIESSVPTGMIVEGFNSGYTSYIFIEAFVKFLGTALNVFDYPLLAVNMGATLTPLNSATFTIPDMTGTVTAQRTNGGSNVLGTQAFSNINADLPGAVGGEGTHVLTINELASHAHTQSYGLGGGATVGNNGFFNRSSDALTSNSTYPTGGDLGHNNVQPTIIVERYVKW